MGMIGNKTVLVPPNVLQSIKIIFIHDLYYYTMASRYELSQENGGNIPMFQNQTTDVSLLCGPWHARRNNTASKCKTIGKRMRGRGEEEETERGEERAL